MFSLHETTRRRLCRTIFVLVCLVPTCAIVVLAIFVRTDRYRRYHELALSDALGLETHVERVRSPRPGIELYRGVTILEPETREPLVRIWMLEVYHDSDAVRVRASFPEINAARPESLWKALQYALRGKAGGGSQPLELTATQLTLKSRGAAQTVADVEARLENARDSSRASASFHVAGAGKAAEPVEIQVSRSRQTSPPTTACELHTGATALDGRLLAMAWPQLAVLGKPSALTGSLWTQQSGDSWQADFAGQLTIADLEKLVSEQFPHKLAGPAVVTARRARLRDGRLEEAAGTLVSGPGVISRTLIDAAAGALACTLVREPHSAGESLMRYRQLAFAFELDRNGLLLRGKCDDALPGAILVDHFGVLLTEPPEQPQPVFHLVKALAPYDESQARPSPEAETLSRWLPSADGPTPVARKTAIPSAGKIRVRAR